MLFSFESERASNPKEAIRTYPYSSRELLTDVYIFEASETIENYILVIMKGNPGLKEVEEETYFSLTMLSFIEIEVLEMPF